MLYLADFSMTDHLLGKRLAGEWYMNNLHTLLLKGGRVGIWASAHWGQGRWAACASELLTDNLITD